MELMLPTKRDLLVFIIEKIKENLNSFNDRKFLVYNSLYDVHELAVITRVYLCDDNQYNEDSIVLCYDRYSSNCIEQGNCIEQSEVVLSDLCYKQLLLLAVDYKQIY